MAILDKNEKPLLIQAEKDWVKWFYFKSFKIRNLALN
jgi:hypothetical protein